MGALAHAVHSGKALYAGLSNYKSAETAQAAKILRELGTPCLIHQPRYSMLDRWVEPQLLATLEAEGIGCTVFSPLAKGILTDRYFKGIPADSRAGHDQRFLRPSDITDAVLAKTKKLNDLAHSRGQTLAQMALAWVLVAQSRDERTHRREQGEPGGRLRGCDTQLELHRRRTGAQCARRTSPGAGT